MYSLHDKTVAVEATPPSDGSASTRTPGSSGRKSSQDGKDDEDNSGACEQQTCICVASLCFFSCAGANGQSGGTHSEQTCLQQVANEVEPHVCTKGYVWQAGCTRGYPQDLAGQRQRQGRTSGDTDQKQWRQGPPSDKLSQY